MDPQDSLDLSRHGLDCRSDVGGKGAAVGVAEDHPLGSGTSRRFDHREGIGGVVAEAVEEVLGIEEDPLPSFPEKGDRFPHHVQTLLQGGVEGIGHVAVP